MKENIAVKPAAFVIAVHVFTMFFLSMDILLSVIENALNRAIQLPV